MRNKIEGRRVASVLAGALAGVLAPAAAFGYGVEVPENGGVAFGRAGAFVARASDPSAVMLNPGALGNLRGFQLTLSGNFVFFDHCFQRSGSYDDGNYNVNVGGTVFETVRNGMGTGDAPYIRGGVPYPRVCNESALGLAVQLLGTYRIADRYTIGFGLFSPSTVGSTQNFADRTTTTSMGMSLDVPSPARYLLYRKKLTVLYPTVAFGARITRWLNLGLAMHVGYAAYQFGLNANAVRDAPQSPASDIFIDLNANALFPAFTVGFQLTPHRFISVGGSFRYNFPIVASGTANTVAGLYARSAMDRATGSFEIQRMEVNMPWVIKAGVRFALPRAGRPTQDDGTGRYDPMTDDVFDVEADFNYEQTSMLGSVSLTNRGSIPIDRSGGAVPAPANITINSALSNVWGIRLGGDYNVVPGVLAVRAGVSYESSGANPALAQIHLPTYAGVGINAGVSWRWRWLTTTLGYSHIFFDTNDASNGERAVVVPSPQLDAATACNAPSTRGPGACTINRGVYEASFNAVNLSFSLRL